MSGRGPMDDDMWDNVGPGKLDGWIALGVVVVLLGCMVAFWFLWSVLLRSLA